VRDDDSRPLGALAEQFVQRRLDHALRRCVQGCGE
jgi:hypothetical protein